jgi:hypothetical protein
MPEAKMLSFEALVTSLPSCDGPERFPVSAERDDVLYRPDGLPEFVGPSLSERADISAVADPSIVIIAAAGAVGKSTLAGELARRKAAPLWDLARSKSVGQGSVDGMITQVFGRGAKSSEVYRALSESTLFFVVDALDEARVKVTETAFEDFLKDLGHLAKEGTGVKAVLFGRTQIAETAWLLLYDMGVATAFYTIDPFTEEQAFQYIERRIRRLDNRASASMDQNPKPFTEARDLLFSKLRDAVQGNRSQEQAAPEIRAFLGYAPVLDAMAIRLTREPNWALQKQQIASSMDAARGDGKHRPAALLRQVIEAVLAREHEQKLVSNLKPVLEPLAKAANWSDWPLLYSVDEQCARVLARHLDFTTTVSQSLKLPTELGARYEERLGAWLPEHPFLRDGKTIVNVVFEAYLFARALSEDLGGARTAVEARLRQPNYFPTRLLSEFYLLSKSGQDTPEVAPEHVGWLYDSMLSDETPHVRIEFSLDGPDPFDPETTEGPHDIEGEFIFVRNGGPDETSRRVEFKTRVWERSTVTFGRYIKHCLLTLPCQVVIGTGADEFEIGPRVQIACRKLHLNAKAFVIGGQTRKDDLETNAVVLEAQECQTACATKPTVRAIPLRVSWPGSNVFPWTDYSQEQKEPYPPDSEMASAYRRFRRIVMTLRSHSRGGLARYKGKVDHQRVLKGQMGRDLLARLLRDGIMRLSDEFYHWVPDSADRLVGISWHQLRRGETSTTLTAYLESFVRARS